MTDAVGEALGGIGNAAMGIGKDIGGAVGGLAGDIAGAGSSALSGIEGLFGAPQGAGATSAPGGPTGSASMSAGMPQVPSMDAAPSGGGGATGSAGAVASALPSETAALAFNPNPTDLNVAGPADQAFQGSVSPVNVQGGPAPKYPALALAPQNALPGDINPMGPVDQALHGITSGQGGAGVAAPGAPGAAGAAAAHPGTGDWLSKLMTPGGLLKGAELGLSGMNLLNANKDPASLKALKSELSHQQGERTLQEHQLAAEQAGSVPQGIKAQMDLQLEQEKAAIRSQYASAGMSGSSAERQDLAAADVKAQGALLQYAQNLVQQSINQIAGSDQNVSNMLSGIYQGEMAKDKQFASAVGDFFSALGIQRPPSANVQAQTGHANG